MSFQHLPGDGPAVVRYPLNERGRDFVVGDIHGMFPHLEVLLERIGFDQTRDRLFSVGDLIDRGPASRQAVQWLERGWFHACRGNHEQFAIESEDREEMDYWVRYNGGEWWLELTPAEQERYRRAFLKMPLAMEIETEQGIVGIVHADIPPQISWERFTELLDARHGDVVMYALFSRHRIHGAPGTKRVKGEVARIYCGHTPVREPVRVHNVHYIDTGAVYALEGFDGARLTVVEFHPGAHREFHIRTDRPI